MKDLDMLVAGITAKVEFQLTEGRQSGGAGDGASDRVLDIASIQIPGVVENLIESNPNIDGSIG